MKINKVIVSVCLAVSGMIALPGCGLSRSEQPAASYCRIIPGAQSAEQLKSAIVTAASRRRWVPTEVAPGIYRCVINQRSNHVEIEIRVLEDGKSYSLTPIDYNISYRKVDQWTTNLQREIQKQVSVLPR